MTMTTMKSLNFGYYINLNERGCFNADVRNMDGKSLMEVGTDENGEVWQVEDGFMRGVEDLSGLTKYAVDMGILPAGAAIHDRQGFEKLEAEWDEALSVIEQFEPKAKIAELYDDNEDLADALNLVINDFEYPDHSHKTVAALVEEIKDLPKQEPKKSTSMRMG